MGQAPPVAVAAKKLTTLFLNWIVAVVTENQKLKSTLFFNPSAVLRASKKLSFSASTEALTVNNAAASF